MHSHSSGLDVKSGIYKITSPSGKVYIGSASNFAKRKERHLYLLRSGRHHNAGLQAAFAKYGEARLVFELIETCSTDALIEREQAYIDAHPREKIYNACLTAGNRTGVRHSSEARAKMSAFHTGRAKTAEHKAKIGAAHKGKTLSDAHREHLRQLRTGTKASVSTSAKLSAQRAGKMRSTNTSGFCGVSLHGKKWAAEINSKTGRRRLGSFATPALAYAMRLVYLAALPPEGV